MTPRILEIRHLVLLATLPAALLGRQRLHAQVQVVDMIPQSMSDEVQNNAEPYIAVNPANPLLIAATAFMSTPPGSPNGPLLVSDDGGNSWTTQDIIPSSPGAYLNTGDQTIHFNSAGTALYAAILRVGDGGGMQVLRTTDMTLTTPFTIISTPGATDQPYIYARQVTGWFDAGQDRAWVANNDGGTSPTTATINQSLNAGVGATPPFTVHQIDADAPVGSDSYQVRTVAGPDGYVYGAFYRRKGSVPGGYNADVVVVRDNNWGGTTPPYESLVDNVTTVAGQNVVVGKRITDTFGNSTALGKDWWGGDLYLTVDPNNSANVYISYSDSDPGSDRTIHLRRSNDHGQTWGPDLLTIHSAKNAAIAINSQGKIAYLYQQLAGTSPNLRWQTRLRRSSDGVAWDNVLLADFPAEGTNSPSGSRVLGDYLNMVAVGKNFYGVFSSYNDLAHANFPHGVSWLRNKTAPGAPNPHFLGVDSATTVNPSVDPFFFRTTEIDPDQDFYVRDWTDNATVHDEGQEPSIRSNFFSTSDVWNRRMNNPHAFDANDRPEPQDPRPASMGHNWAFVRVSRAASGTPADVNVRFLYSDGGVGVPYVSAGPPTTIHFNAGESEKTLGPGSGYRWDLPSGASNHVCLAVEISTPNDPIIPPGLLGHAPGWPTTDLMVVADNNKAQRNMNVFGFGSTHGGSQAASAYAIIGNAADHVRDVQVGLAVDPRRIHELQSATVSVIGGPGPAAQPVEPGAVITLPAMKPGETRWLELRFTPSGSIQAPLPVTINELVNGRAVNGYAFVATPMPLGQAIRATLFQHEAVFSRLADVGIPGAARLAQRASRLLESDAVSPTQYAALVADVAEQVRRSAKALVAAGEPLGDPFGVVDAADQLGMSADPAEMQIRHLSLLNRLDATTTFFQRSGKQLSGSAGRPTLLLAFDVGSSHPIGNLDRVADANVYVNGELGLRLGNAVALEAVIGLAQFTAESAASIEHPRWVHISADARAVLPMGNYFGLYLRGGPGLYIPKSGPSDFGLNLGLGAEITIHAPFKLQFGVDYHWINDDASTQFITTDLGPVVR